MARAPRLLLAALLASLGAFGSTGCVGECKSAGAPERQPLGFMAQYAADVCLGPAAGPALTVTISVEDGTLGLGSAGELRSGAATEAMTPFRLGALSELYTAALVGRLVDQGRINLGASVTDSLDWAVTDEPITVRQLLTHRSGLKDVGALAAVDLADPVGPRSLVETAISKGLRFTPGEKHALSATDYLLLGLIVEAELGQEFGLALHQNVLDPFGLGATLVDGFDELPDNLALGHTGAGGALDEAFAAQNGGGAWSIVAPGTDVERFLRLVFEDDTFLADVTRLEYAFPADGEAGDEGFGFGVAIEKLDGEVAWRRSGEHPGGYGAAMVYLPEHEVASVALTNARPSRPGLVADLAADFGLHFAPPLPE